MAGIPVVTYFALYRADLAGAVDEDEGVTSICVGLFGDYEDAITEARAILAEGYSISIDIGEMTQADWDAIEEVPDDFSPRKVGTHLPAEEGDNSPADQPGDVRGGLETPGTPAIPLRATESSS
jgi:hypothetical protein